VVWAAFVLGAGMVLVVAGVIDAGVWLWRKARGRTR
jgi:hypothetical protein